MKHFFIVFTSLILFSFTSFAKLKFSTLTTSDNKELQTCVRYPDEKTFPGPRPALMLIMGSGRYDSCKSLESSYAEELSNKGIVVFARQKRGLMRDLNTGKLVTDLSLYEECDLPHLKMDTLLAYDSIISDPRVQNEKTAVFGGSEGTILATYIGLRREQIKELVLVSSMIENFPSLFERQAYDLVPKMLLSDFDKDKNERLSSQELPSEYLEERGLEIFQKIDTNQDSQLNFEELSNEIRRVVKTSLEKNLQTYFLSDLGGGVTSQWMKSALKEEELGPRVLQLKVPATLHHGTADQSTRVEPVYQLEKEAKKLGKDHIHFHYYEDLDHALTMEIIIGEILKAGERLLKD